MVVLYHFERNCHKRELFLFKPVIITAMADYNRRNQSGNNRSFGKPRFNRERTEMFSATCANCGKQCEVPFRPTGNKPVLCRECFQNNRGADSQRSFDRPRFNNDDSRGRRAESPNYNAQFEALNAKMDTILELLTPKTVSIAPMESEISEEAIDEIVEEVQEEKKNAKEKKTKKDKILTAKSPKKKSK
jgi:CxxC-x17-CxxC domain-containing protein